MSENRDNPNERLIFSSDQGKLQPISSTDFQPTIEPNLIFTAYGINPKNMKRPGLLDFPDLLRISSFPKITGYVGDISPFSSIIPREKTPYRFIVHDGPLVQNGHNFFTAAIFRDLRSGELDAYGAVTAERLSRMARAVLDETLIDFHNRSERYDFEHLKKLPIELLEKLLINEKEK